eukprot:SAG11_NODE_16512_length_545_cov_1.154709_1_plen_28_part_01
MTVPSQQGAVHLVIGCHSDPVSCGGLAT